MASPLGSTSFGDAMAAIDDVALSDSNETGIIWAYRFAPDGSAQSVGGDPIDEVLARPGGWTWVHLGLADNRCRNWIAERAPLSDAAKEILADPDDHLRLDTTGSEIIGIFPDLQQALMHPTEELVRLRFVITDTMLITARRRAAHAVELTRRSIESGRRFPTPMSVLAAIIDQFANTVDQMIDTLGAELDTIEQLVLHEEPGNERARLGKARLQVVRLHRQLAQLRSLFHRIEPRLAEEHGSAAMAISTLTQKIDELTHDATAVHERTRLLLDEAAGKMAALTNRRLFTLSVLTGCLLPPTLVTGFFGMNTADLPFQNTEGGTWYAMLVAAAAGAFTYWALARLRAL
jgi:zinc transporter